MGDSRVRGAGRTLAGGAERGARRLLLLRKNSRVGVAQRQHAPVAAKGHVAGLACSPASPLHMNGMRHRRPMLAAMHTPRKGTIMTTVEPSSASSRLRGESVQQMEREQTARKRYQDNKSGKTLRMHQVPSRVEAGEPGGAATTTTWLR